MDVKRWMQARLNPNRSGPEQPEEAPEQKMSVRQRVIDQLWAGRDPFAGFPSKTYAVDIQGWNSNHAYLSRAIDELRPSVVVEVGVWKGGSVLTMARRMRDLQVDGVVIAVDTWLGAWDHWLNPAFFEDLGFENGYPKLFHRFMANVIHEGLQDYVVPLPLDSSNAARVLREKGLHPQVMHVDAAHDYEAVRTDLALWWSMLTPGGVMIADDYIFDGRWPEVKRAVDDFYAVTPHEGFEADDCKAWTRKLAA